jgi:hypothetical protein
VVLEQPSIAIEFDNLNVSKKKVVDAITGICSFFYSKRIVIESICIVEVS